MTDARGSLVCKKINFREKIGHKIIDDAGEKAVTLRKPIE